MDESSRKQAPGSATTPITPTGDQRPGTDPSLGALLDGRYQLRRVLGEGGMGKVYLAADLRLSSRPVAVKVMRSALTANPEFRKRFEREALLQANLRHPQIIQVLDVGECAEGMYIVMEYSEGRSLASLLKAMRPGAVERSLVIIEQILEVLDVAHRRSVIHRDLKPSNVLIEDQSGRDVVKVLDFGIAKVLGERNAQEVFHTVTEAGGTFGTLGYMAPEQALGDAQSTDHRADIYAAGIILYELLTGHVPCPRASRGDLVQYALWVHQNTITPIREVYPELGVPEHLDAIVMMALARDPAQRFQSAFDFLSTVQEFRRTGHASAAAKATARRAEVPKTSSTKATAMAPARRAAPGARITVALLALVAVGLGTVAWLQRSKAESLGSSLEAARTEAERAGIAEGALPERIRALAARADGGEALATLRTEKAAAERARDEARSTAGQTQEKLNAAEAASRSATTRAERAESDRDELKRRHATVETDLQSALREKSRAEGELDAAKTSLATLAEERAGLERRARDAEARLAAAELQAKEDQAEIERLKKQPVSDERVRQLEERVGGLLEDLKLKDQRIRDRDQTIDELDRRLRDRGSTAPPTPPVVVSTATCELRNGGKYQLGLARITATVNGAPTVVTLPKATVQAGQTLAIPIPAGTTRIEVVYRKWRYAERVWDANSQTRSFEITGAATTATIDDG